MQRVFVFIALVALGSCASPSHKLSDDAPIVTDTGSVVSFVADYGVLQWFDIPYAQPPVGELRWRAPQPLAAADQVIYRQSDPIICPQVANSVNGVDGDAPIGREDCLYLDITAPQNADGSKTFRFSNCQYSCRIETTR